MEVGEDFAAGLSRIMYRAGLITAGWYLFVPLLTVKQIVCCVADYLAVILELLKLRVQKN